jgi:hypothetical protein
VWSGGGGDNRKVRKKTAGKGRRASVTSKKCAGVGDTIKTKFKRGEGRGPLATPVCCQGYARNDCAARAMPVTIVLPGLCP